KSPAISNYDSDLAKLFSQRQGGYDDFQTGPRAADDFEQSHHMRGTEKMRADHHIGARGHRSDLLDVECRGVCCKYAAISCNLIDFAEDLLLQSQVLEDRFNDDVNVLETIVGKLGADQRHPLTHRLRSQSSLIDRYSVILADREPAAIQSELV